MLVNVLIKRVCGEYCRRISSKSSLLDVLEREKYFEEIAWPDTVINKKKT